MSSFERMKKPFGLTKWNGVTGDEHALTQGEWQRVLLQAGSDHQTMVYYGMGTLLGYFDPGSALGLDLSQIPAMLLFDRTENDRVYLNATKAEHSKVLDRLRAETAWGTAALVSLRGVKTMVLNRGPTGFEGSSSTIT